MSEQQHKIMAVDDEPKNLKIMQDLLEDDYSLFLANSGAECLENFDDFKPDIILLDIMMPGMDGYEVCKWIVENENRNDAQIIFVSANDTLEDRLKGYETGATEYFAKPFDFDELLVKIENILLYKSNLSSTRESVQNASKVAMNAMASASGLGQVVRFMQESFEVQSIKGLANKLLETTQSLSLNCTVQLRSLDGEETYNDQGSASPLEEEILHKGKDKGRIYDVKDKSFFNYETVSLFVKNMPTDDEIKYGEIKDFGCFLLDGVEARIKSINTEMEIMKQKTYLTSIIEYASSTMGNVNDDMTKLRLEGAAIVEDMMEQVDELMPRLGLEENQENALMEITEGGVNKTTELFNRQLRVDGKFISTIEKLRKICDEGNVDSNKMGEIFKDIL